VPVTVPHTEFTIHNAIYVIPAASAAGLPHPYALFHDHFRPDPRLLARAGSDPDRLVAVKPGSQLRCAGGPRWLIDLDATRRRGATRARERYECWHRDPRSIRLRGWEKTLVRAGLPSYVEYWRLRLPVADALICVDGPALCPADASVESGRRYAEDANRVLDALPDDALIIAAAV
jgi:hypothetical protein